ncbi:DUF317 domain-containing protein [Streptomyces sp. NBC_01264]|uniref:DUF317 domain-containing protein n=1 Tax=Streptomyces sp. NBC_01264 TaxID=2903804 RepID=UPI0022512E0D|nr:DUF317 domain-containing protein [Streptomyces sp. NBC_01264]MCX4776847.1 DUF317 domain-containing protein [Streptomyces sp. NBC_01264]
MGEASSAFDADDLDGDVYVTPRYLAGTTYIGDPGLQPLRDLGWPLDHDNLGNCYVTSPDRRVRLGYLPEGEDDGLWRISAYRDPHAAPVWGVCFNDKAPTEFVTAFTEALAQGYTEGPGSYLPHMKGSAYDGLVPMIHNGWKLTRAVERTLEWTSPDKLAGVAFTTGDLDPEMEFTTLEARWFMWGGPKGWDRWYATASTETPVSLITAITAAIADPAPILRWEQEMPKALRERAELTPVRPASPKAPTPLDVARARPRVLPSARTHSVPRWSTSSAPGARLPVPTRRSGR